MKYNAIIKRLFSRILPRRVLSRLKKNYYARKIRTFWEMDVEPIKYLVRPGDAVVDVGAHVGWYTLVLSDLVSKSGHVYSIEPIPETFEILRTLFGRYQFKHVQPINCAISDRDGFVVMEIPVDRHGLENFYQARITGDYPCDNGLRQYRVLQRSIDSLFPGSSKKITFIKCDAEGHEYAVVEGGKQLIEKDKPAWMIEVSGDPDNESSVSKRLFDYLSGQNYRPYWFDGKKLCRRRVGDKLVNYYFLQPQHVKQLYSHGMLELEEDAKRF